MTKVAVYHKSNHKSITGTDHMVVSLHQVTYLIVNTMAVGEICEAGCI